jgi:hypothetical protein
MFNGQARGVLALLAVVLFSYSLLHWHGSRVLNTSTVEDPEFATWLRLPYNTYKQDTLVLYLLSRDHEDAAENFEYFVAQVMA